MIDDVDRHGYTGWELLAPSWLRVWVALNATALWALGLGFAVIVVWAS